MTSMKRSKKKTNLNGQMVIQEQLIKIVSTLQAWTNLKSQQSKDAKLKKWQEILKARNLFLRKIWDVQKMKIWNGEILAQMLKVKEK